MSSELVWEFSKAVGLELWLVSVSVSDIFDCYGIRTRAGLAFFSLSGYPQATKQENQIERTLSAEEEIQIPRIEDIWDFHGFIYLAEQ